MKRSFKSNMLTNGRIRKDPSKTGKYVKYTGKTSEPESDETDENLTQVKLVVVDKQRTIVRKGAKLSRKNNNV